MSETFTRIASDARMASLSLLTVATHAAASEMLLMFTSEAGLAIMCASKDRHTTSVSLSEAALVL